MNAINYINSYVDYKSSYRTMSFPEIFIDLSNNNGNLF